MGYIQMANMPQMATTATVENRWPSELLAVEKGAVETVAI
jgi:hypothetical protein